MDVEQQKKGDVQMTRNQWPFLPRSEGLSLKTNSMASMSCGHVFLNDECLYVCIMYMRVYTYHNIYIYICKTVVHEALQITSRNHVDMGSNWELKISVLFNIQ